HIIRNNLIRRCGQAGIIGVLHGTRSEIYGNQIEDIGVRGDLIGEEAAGIRLAVSIYTIVRGNPVPRLGTKEMGNGVVRGPLYQGVRITGNVISDTGRSGLYFYISHGPALVDNNIIVGGGAETGEGVKLRGAEANVFAQNLFVDCGIT